MITILSKIFIKDYKNIRSCSVRQLYGVLCGSFGIFLNILLFLGKFLAGTLSNSIAITADAFNNLSDAGSSFITLIGFKLAGQKADSEHPFGHGRMEYLSGLFVSVTILIMALELIKSSVSKITNPVMPEFSPLIAVILIISILVKIYMAFYNHSIGKKIDSSAMMATAIDSASDTIATFVVLLSAVISQVFHLQIDGYCGILVGLFILYSGIEAIKDTINPLLGQPPEKSFVDEIKHIVMSYDMIIGIHDLVVHDYGPGRVMISLHAEVSAKENILLIHDTIDQIENKLKKELYCEAVIHMDPVITDNNEINCLKEHVEKIILGIDKCLNFHDFRVVIGPTHTNIIFDVLVPYKFKFSDDMIVKRIQDEVKGIDNSYNTVINIDHIYI